jgi:hypothetical protein
MFLLGVDRLLALTKQMQCFSSVFFAFQFIIHVQNQKNPKIKIPKFQSSLNWGFLSDSVSISFSQPFTIPVFHDHRPLVLHNSPHPSSTTSFSPATLRTRVHPTTTASLQSPPVKLLCLSCFSGSLFSIGNYQRLGVLFFPCPFLTLMQ